MHILHHFYQFCVLFGAIEIDYWNTVHEVKSEGLRSIVYKEYVLRVNPFENIQIFYKNLVLIVVKWVGMLSVESVLD